MDSYLKTIYYDPRHPASFSSALKLYKAAKSDGKRITLKFIKRWLAKSDVYTTHRKVIRRFPRNKTVSSGLNVNWQSDLAQMEALSRENNSFKFLLIAVDVFSRYAYVVPIKSKSAESMVKGFKELFKQAGTAPQNLQSDRGKEYLSKSVQDLFRKNGVNFFTSDSNSEHKSSIAERFIRTLKNKLYKYFTYKGSYRYLNVLPHIVKAYNNTVHPAINARPSDVKPHNQYFFWKNYHSLLTLQKPPPKIYV